VTVFPKLFATQGHIVVDDQIVVVRGRLDRRDESRSLFMASDVSVVDVPKNGIESLYIDFARRSLGAGEVDDIRALLEQHPGNSPVFLMIGDKTVALGPTYAVDVGKVIGLLRVKFGNAVSIR
jgi:DNA polymerase-3 subunit alpha